MSNVKPSEKNVVKHLEKEVNWAKQNNEPSFIEKLFALLSAKKTINDKQKNP